MITASKRLLLYPSSKLAARFVIRFLGRLVLVLQYEAYGTSSAVVNTGVKAGRASAVNRGRIGPGLLLLSTDVLFN